MTDSADQERIRALEQQVAMLEQQIKCAADGARRNVSLLSEIGRKLTARLDTEAVMAMLYDHVTELMDASVFGIGIYRPEHGLIDYPFAVERGKRYAPYSRSMKDPNQLPVWCIRNEREVFINDLETEFAQYIDHLELTSSKEHMGTLADGSLPTEPQSLLYVPISVNGRVRGVVTVHSYRKHAYERYHLDLLRTLASYIGAAFENADAYGQLKDTQAQLMAQEKLAALGSMVAGISHELNTPIGNSLLMASTLQEKANAIAERFEQAQVRKSDLASFIEAAREAASLIQRSLMNAADLVSSFKQVAVDQASAHRRKFNLAQVLHEIVSTMMNNVRKAGHTLDVEVPADVQMNSYPGPLGQIIINFINNALLHAFEHKGGKIVLSVSTPRQGRVLIRFEDNGAGIAPEHLERIFDPFFTTKQGQGGSGLGLNISHNLVKTVLNGEVSVESTLGHGTVFLLDLPLDARTQDDCA